MTDFAAYLKAIRLKRKYSIRKLALKSHISIYYLAALERNEYQHPSVAILNKLASALNVSKQELYFAAGYIDHPLKEIDVQGLPKVDRKKLDEKLQQLNNKTKK